MIYRKILDTYCNLAGHVTDNPQDIVARTALVNLDASLKVAGHSNYNQVTQYWNKMAESRKSRYRFVSDDEDDQPIVTKESVNGRRRKNKVD